MMENRWAIYNEKNNIFEPINETKENKYLGIKFGKGPTFAKQMKHIEKRCKVIVNLIKAKANNTDAPHMAAKCLWEAAIRISLLNCSGSMIFSNSLVRIINRAQGNIAKWILQTSKTASLTISSTILQWRDISTIIAQTQISWLGKLLTMKNERLPKKIYFEMVSKYGTKWKWFKATHTAMETHGLTSLIFRNDNWKDCIKKTIKKVNQQNIRIKLNINEESLHMFSPFEETIESTLPLNILRKAITNDTWSIMKIVQPTACTKCKALLTSWKRHILIECPYTLQHNPFEYHFLQAFIDQRDNWPIITHIKEDNKLIIKWIATILTNWKTDANENSLAPE